ncbi:hypothetical protein EVAR_58084_1 [Eumeta japonica]|uniref:Uncharacterized protein n=1 Tax=Eumeta variegata TaxID=151549 RepID=A0A4C1ZF57_EUMVA|nr:hypothetical protein EVAR_58084_1 [Eumeta japonica]
MNNLAVNSNSGSDHTLSSDSNPALDSDFNTVLNFSPSFALDSDRHLVLDSTLYPSHSLGPDSDPTLISTSTLFSIFGSDSTVDYNSGKALDFVPCAKCNLDSSFGHTSDLNKARDKLYDLEKLSSPTPNKFRGVVLPERSWALFWDSKVMVMTEYLDHGATATGSLMQTKYEIA